MKKMKNTQVDAYKGSRSPKQHHIETLDLIRSHYPDFNGSLLDIGCAAGVFAELFAHSFPKSSVTGIDVNEELLDIAKTECEAIPNITFETGDAIRYKAEKQFNVITASGVLSIFEDFTEPLQSWISWLAPQGVLCIFGGFNSRNIDKIVRFRNNYTNGEWEGGLSTYSIHTVGAFLDTLGVSHSFKKFHLKIDLEESEDPIRSFTKTTVTGEKIIINGANTIDEYFHLTIKKK